MTTGLTYAQRNALAVLPALPPLAKGALTYTPGKPQFSDLAAQTLGNAGTPDDGFDALFASVAGIVDADIASLSTLDGILADAGFVTGAIGAALLDPVAHEMAAFVTVGDSAITDFDNQVGQGGGSSGTGGGCS